MNPTYRYQNESSLALVAAAIVEEAGFKVRMTGDRHFLVKVEIKPGYTILSQDPTFETIAEVEVWLEGEQTVMVVEQLVYGELRPKIDALIECLLTLPIEGLHVIKSR